jgi:hypothetical protein
VWAAVKNALSYVAPGTPIDLQLPATGEEILRCLTQVAKQQRAASESLASAATPNPLT